MEEEAGKGVGLPSKTETLAGEDANTVQVLGNSVSDENHVKADVESAEETKDNVEKRVSSDDVVKTDAFTEPVTERDLVEYDVDAGTVAEKLVNGEIEGEEEETVTSTVADEKVNCEVKDSGGDDSEATNSDVEHNVQTDKSLQSSVDAETLSVAEEKADLVKESANERGEDMDVDTKQGNEENVESETKDAKHTETVHVPQEATQLSKDETNKETPVTVSAVSPAAEIRCEEETTNVNEKQEDGEAMEIDYAAEESFEKDVLDNAGSESTQDVPIAEADKNDSNLVKEMEIDEGKDNADMASDLTVTNESADAANPSSLTENVAPGEVEPLDHSGLFDPRSDITNFIDFTGETETGNASMKDDKKATDMAEEDATEDCNEALKTVGSTECPKEACDEILGSDENQEEKDHPSLDKKTVEQQDSGREEDDTTHEAPSIDPDQTEDTVMEENPKDSDCADIKTSGVKRKADVLSEDSLGEGRKTVSLAKISFAQRPSFKIGACIARAATQMAGSPSVLKGSTIGDETLSVEGLVSQLHSAATDPVKENVVSNIAAEFFLDFRNSSASQQYTPEASNKRGRPSNSNVGGTEAFEFEEMGDTYWTDKVIHNGGEEQTPPTEKENDQVVPVELKPAEVKRTRRRYRRRQSQISLPLPSDSDRPANFDENAPAELIMNFSETDTIPPEKSLSKMFRHFGPIRDSQTEVDKEKNRARVVFRKGSDAEVAYNSARKFNIFGTKAVNYELCFTITETFKVQPYVVSVGEEEAMLPIPS